MVALEHDSGTLQVKRVVGLPGESLRIAGGDLWIDGRRYQKGLSQLQQRAVLVHDDRYRPPDGSRWRARRGWVTTPEGHRWSANREPSDSACSDQEWLVYHHYSPHAAGRSDRESPVLDDYPSNQTIHRQLWPVSDLGVSLRIDAAPGTHLELAVWNGERPVRAGFLVDRPDQRLYVAWLDGRLVANVLLTPANAGDFASVPVTAGRPLGIRPSSQGEVAIAELRVIRDLHLLGPPGEELEWTAPRLADNRFFVLGDNVPASLDSRDAPAGVPRGAIVGRVNVRKEGLGAAGGVE